MFSEFMFLAVCRMIHCDTAGCRGFQPLPSWPYAWRYRDFPTSYCGNPAACIRAERRTLRQRLRTFRAAFSVFSTDTDRYASSKSLPHGNPTQPASLPFAFSSAYGCPLDRSFLTPNLRCAMIIVQHKPNFRSRLFFTEERSCIPSDRSQNSQVSPFRRFAITTKRDCFHKCSALPAPEFLKSGNSMQSG